MLPGCIAEITVDMLPGFIAQITVNILHIWPRFYCINYCGYVAYNGMISLPRLPWICYLCYQDILHILSWTYCIFHQDIIVQITVDIWLGYIAKISVDMLHVVRIYCIDYCGYVALVAMILLCRLPWICCLFCQNIITQITVYMLHMLPGYFAYITMDIC